MNSHRKGSLWRRAIQVYLSDNGILSSFRSIGETGDDIQAGLLSIEAKNAARIELAAWVDQAETQRRRPASLPIVWIKRRGKVDPGDGYVVMRGETFVKLIEGTEWVR